MNLIPKILCVSTVVKNELQNEQRECDTIPNLNNVVFQELNVV